MLWYLLSDSQPLRDSAREKFGDKLLVTIPGEGMALGHSTGEQMIHIKVSSALRVKTGYLG